MPAAPVREGTVSFGPWETWFRVRGEMDDRPPLICVHGGPGSTHHYFAHLEELAEQDRAVIVYDQVGCGRSSRPPVKELSMQVFVAELVNVRERLGLESAHVLGTSWGGMLALEYALMQPVELRGLILSSTLACARSWADEARRLRDALPDDLRSALIANDRDDPLHEEAETAFFERHVCRLGVTPEITRMLAEKGAYVYEALWGPNEWTPTVKLARWDVRDRLSELDVPVLITAGEHDLCTSAILGELQQGLPSAQTVVFEKSAHMPYLEQAEAYRSVVGDFLDQVDGAAKPSDEEDT